MNSSQSFNSEFICLTLEKVFILIMLHSKSSNFHLSRKIDIITEDGNNSTEWTKHSSLNCRKCKDNTHENNIFDHGLT